LLQTVNGIADEYGWALSYEEAPYISAIDLVDHTPPEWRSAFPNGRRFWRARGGSLVTRYSEDASGRATSLDERQVLSRVVSDYNASGNPGKFAVRTLAHGGYSVVCTAVHNGRESVSVTPILETQILPPRVSTDAMTALEMLFKLVSAKRGIAITIGAAPENILARRQVSIGGSSVSARDFLVEIIDDSKLNLNWRLLYDAGARTFTIDLLARRKVAYDLKGMRVHERNENGANVQVGSPDPRIEPGMRYRERAQFRRSEKGTTLVASSQRPLVQAVFGLADAYGWALSFEEPPYFSMHDLVDHTPAAWRAASPTGPRFLRVRGGAFSSTFSFDVGTSTATPAVQAVLSRVVRDYNASANPGRFEFRSLPNNVSYVVGTRVTDAGGATVAVTPLLDTQIGMPRVTTDAMTALGILTETLSAQTSMRVSLGLVPVNTLVQRRVVVGGKAAAARDLLMQIIEGSGTHLNWRLIYDPSERAYTLNLAVRRRISFDPANARMYERVVSD
jgi:hypothetical protein